MGARDTFSRLHRDRGGMSILIAPITGQKELIMCHRDDGRLLYHGSASVTLPSSEECFYASNILMYY